MQWGSEMREDARQEPPWPSKLRRVASPRGLCARGVESVSHTGQTMPAAGCCGPGVPARLKLGWMRASARAHTCNSSRRPGCGHRSPEFWPHSVSGVSVLGQPLRHEPGVLGAPGAACLGQRVGECPAGSCRAHVGTGQVWTSA